MISTDFAPNESWDDAVLSLKLLFQPWRWRNGPELNEVKKRTLDLLRVSSLEFRIYTFLTGRSALFHLLKSYKLPPNSEVIIQAFTCEAVVLPILANNFKPIYVDIEAKTFSMNPIDLEKKITSKSKVLVLQHTFGLTPDRRNEIVELVKKHNLVLIEDIAHTIKNVAQEGSKNTQAFLLSFGRSKALSSVFGGAVVTCDNRIASRILIEEKKLGYPGFDFILKILLYKPLSMLIKSTYDSYIGKLLHVFVEKTQILTREITKKEKGGKFDEKLDKDYPNALAVLLLHQLNKYDQICKVRASVTRIYAKSFKNQKMKITIPFLLRYPLRVDHRDRLLKLGAKNNIFLGKWYDRVVAPKDINLSKLSYKNGSCPLAEKMCKKIVNLPTTISDQEVRKVIQLLRNYGN